MALHFRENLLKGADLFIPIIFRHAKRIPDRVVAEMEDHRIRAGANDG